MLGKSIDNPYRLRQMVGAGWLVQHPFKQQDHVLHPFKLLLQAFPGYIRCPVGPRLQIRPLLGQLDQLAFDLILRPHVAHPLV